MVSKGNHPQMAQQFRLVKYYNLPIYIYISAQSGWENGGFWKITGGFKHVLSFHNNYMGCHPSH